MYVWEWVEPIYFDYNSDATLWYYKHSNFRDSKQFGYIQNIVWITKRPLTHELDEQKNPEYISGNNHIYNK